MVSQQVYAAGEVSVSLAVGGVQREGERGYPARLTGEAKKMVAVTHRAHEVAERRKQDGYFSLRRTQNSGHENRRESAGAATIPRKKTNRAPLSFFFFRCWQH